MKRSFSAISFRHVSCAYDDVIVLENLSFDIPSGSYYGIVGPSGSGKTTVMKSILGLVPIVHGEVSVFGERVSSLPPPGISYVPQLESIDWEFPMTVEDVVLLGLSQRHPLRPWYTHSEISLAHAMLEKLGMDQVRKKPISALSGGQKQRTFIARALVSSPRLLLLDEPTNGIDVKSRHDLLHLLMDLHKEGVTVVLTTHDLNAVASHLPHLICFNGAIVAEGKPKQVFTERIMRETYGAPLHVIQHTGMMGELPYVTE